jgi:hypothetical protein
LLKATTLSKLTNCYGAMPPLRESNRTFTPRGFFDGEPLAWQVVTCPVAGPLILA